MLVKLGPKEITNNWPTIRHSIEMARPFGTADINKALKNVLFSMLTDRMLCWVILNKDKKVVGIITTTIYEENCSGINYLWVYTAYAFENLDDSIWVDIYKTLEKYGKTKGYEGLLAITNIPRINEVIELLGGDASNTLVSIPFNREV